MATNRILSNAKEFVKSLDEAQLKIHRETLNGISEWSDLVREKAVSDFMEPNKFKSQTIIRRNKNGDVVAWVRTDNGGLVRHTKKQKAVAQRPTTRTGRLASVVIAKGNWKVNRKATEIKFTGKGEAGSHVLMWVRPQSNGYLVRFTFGKGSTGKTGDSFLHGRLWQAKKRPFVEPAIKANESKFDGTVWKRLAPAVNRTV